MKVRRDAPRKAASSGETKPERGRKPEATSSGRFRYGLNANVLVALTKLVTSTARLTIRRIAARVSQSHARAGAESAIG